MAVQVSAIRGERRDRIAYFHTTVPVSDVIPDLLGGLDPRPHHWSRLPVEVRELYEKVQRKVTKARRTAIKQYIIDHMSPMAYAVGSFGPIIIAMPLDQEPGFRPIDPEDDPDVGILRLRKSLQHPSIMLDGIGRFTGFQDVIEDATLPAEVREWAANYRLGVMLLTGTTSHTLDRDVIGQQFHDINLLVTPISTGHGIDLDRSDLYVLTTNIIGALPIIEENGGTDPRAVSVTGDSWTTKTILLKAVRAAAEGPGSHVDHIRQKLEKPWLNGLEAQRTIVERFDEDLTTFVEALPDGVPEAGTLLRTGAWWVAFGLIENDLYRSYEGASISDARREVLLHRLASIDWGLGNPDLAFMGNSVPTKDRKTKEFVPPPVDEQGRQMINRFHGGSKAYCNLAAFMRAKIHLRETVPNYGADYGCSLQFDANGKVVELLDFPAEPEQEREPELVGP